jgi:hypothetical protein
MWRVQADGCCIWQWKQANVPAHSMAAAYSHDIFQHALLVAALRSRCAQCVYWGLDSAVGMSSVSSELDVHKQDVTDCSVSGILLAAAGASCSHRVARLARGWHGHPLAGGVTNTVSQFSSKLGCQHCSPPRLLICFHECEIVPKAGGLERDPFMHLPRHMQLCCDSQHACTVCSASIVLMEQVGPYDLQAAGARVGARSTEGANTCLTSPANAV